MLLLECAVGLQGLLVGALGFLEGALQRGEALLDFVAGLAFLVELIFVISLCVCYGDGVVFGCLLDLVVQRDDL